MRLVSQPEAAPKLQWVVVSPCSRPSIPWDLNFHFLAERTIGLLCGRFVMFPKSF